MAAYGHTFQLLLRFATDRAGTPPSALDIADLDAPLIRISELIALSW